MPGIQFLPLIAIALLFWLLVIRPQSRRSRELQRLQSSLTIGDDVMLTSGIYGTVTHSDEESLHVEIAAGVIIRVARGAIGMVEPREDLTDPDDDERPDRALGAEPEEKN